MAWCLFGNQPLPNLVMTNNQVYPKEYITVNFKLKSRYLTERKCNPLSPPSLSICIYIVMFSCLDPTVFFVFVFTSQQRCLVHAWLLIDHSTIWTVTPWHRYIFIFTSSQSQSSQALLKLWGLCVDNPEAGHFISAFHSITKVLWGTKRYCR